MRGKYFFILFLASLLQEAIAMNMEFGDYDDKGHHSQVIIWLIDQTDDKSIGKKDRNRYCTDLRLEILEGQFMKEQRLFEIIGINKSNIKLAKDLMKEAYAVCKTTKIPITLLLHDEQGGKHFAFSNKWARKQKEITQLFLELTLKIEH